MTDAAQRGRQYDAREEMPKKSPADGASPVERITKMRRELIEREARLVRELEEVRRALVILGRGEAVPGRRKVSYGASVQAVFDAVLTFGDGGCSAREVVAKTGISQNSVWHILHRLETSGDVRREGTRMFYRYFAVGGKSAAV